MTNIDNFEKTANMGLKYTPFTASLLITELGLYLSFVKISSFFSINIRTGIVAVSSNIVIDYKVFFILIKNFFDFLNFQFTISKFWPFGLWPSSRPKAKGQNQY